MPDPAATSSWAETINTLLHSPQMRRDLSQRGWEVDTAKDFDEGNGLAPAGLEVLGHGELVGDTGYTGNMTFYDTPAGGWVLSIGSITLGGSLVGDQHLQQIVRNALNECLAP